MIGVTSCFVGEEKTTISCNLSNFLASQGVSVLLIDGDMRNPGASKTLNQEAGIGLVDVLTEDVLWTDAICIESKHQTHILPNKREVAVHTGELLGGERMSNLLKMASKMYDYVIIDLPPIDPVVDTRAILPNLDGVIFVVKSGVTRVPSVVKILQSDFRLRDKIYGVFLNIHNDKRKYTGMYYNEG